MTEPPVPEGVLRRIVREGARPAPTLVGTVSRLWTELGPGHLFFGTKTRVVLAWALSLLTAVIAAQSGRSLGLVFAFAPVLFLTLAGFVEGAERFGPVAELRRTTRNSGQQLAAFRVLVFGVIGMAFGLLGSGLLSSGQGHVAQSLLIGSLSVSVAAALSLTALERTSFRWVGPVLPFAWVGSWLAVGLFLGDRWDAVLAAVPPLLGWLAVTGSAAFFMRRVRALLLDNSWEVGSRAAG